MHGFIVQHTNTLDIVFIAKLFILAWKRIMFWGVVWAVHSL